MKRKRDLLLIQLLLLLVLLIPTPVTAEPPAPVRQKDESWKGNISNQNDEFIKVVETKQEWNELWMRVFERNAPKIDFEKKVVACVFLGNKADWLYSIHIGEPVLRDGMWVIPYGMAEIILELSGPFKASGQYAMKILKKKTDAPMVMKRDAPF